MLQVKSFKCCMIEDPPADHKHVEDKTECLAFSTWNYEWWTSLTCETVINPITGINWYMTSLTDFVYFTSKLFRIWFVLRLSRVRMKKCRLQFLSRWSYLAVNFTVKEVVFLILNRWWLWWQYIHAVLISLWCARRWSSDINQNFLSSYLNIDTSLSCLTHASLKLCGRHMFHLYRNSTNSMSYQDSSLADVFFPS